MWDEIFAIKRMKERKQEMQIDYHSQEYIDYLKSSTWRKRCNQLKKQRGNRCENCQAEGVRLEVHHLNYDHLGHEQDDDLMILCEGCHEHADRERTRKSNR